MERHTSELRGKRVLVTGGSRGIGKSIVLAFLRHGACVVFAHHADTAAAASLSDENNVTGGRLFGFDADVADEAAVTALIEFAQQRLGGIDIAVNNAGILCRSYLVDMTATEFDRVIAVNLRGTFLVGRAVARVMRKQGVSDGRIINLSSGASVSGRAGGAHYCSSKAAINMLTKVMAIELTPLGITVNAIAPGLIEVPDADLTREYVDAIVSGIPARRIGQPADIARAALFVAEPASDFISGSVIFVDGGSGSGRTTLPLSSKSKQEARQAQSGTD